MAEIEEIKTLIEQGNKTIEALRADVDAVKADDVLAKDKLSKMEKDLADTLSAKQEAELHKEAVEKRIEEMEAKMQRPGNGKTQNADEYKAAFIEFVRHPDNPDAVRSLMEAKATDVQTATAASGGYALPEEISTTIAKQVQDISPIRQIARVVSVGTPDYKELVDLNGFGTEWVGETTARSQTNTPDLGEVAPTFGEIAAKPETTRHALEDLFFDVEGWLQASAVEQFAIAEGAAFVSGDGTNKPTGFLTGTPVATADDARAFGTLQYVATGAAAALSSNPFDEMHDLTYTLKSGYRASSRWVMNSLTMAAFAKVKDADGRYLLQASQSMGAPDMINGYGVTVAEDMPDIGADAFPVAFGDFSRGYLIADRVGMGMIRDNVTKPGYVKYIMFKRVGGTLKDTNAIKLLKVALS